MIVGIFSLLNRLYASVGMLEAHNNLLLGIVNTTPFMLCLLQI
jgi:hypothetical protein